MTLPVKCCWQWSIAEPNIIQEDSEADEEYPLSKTMEMGRSMEASQIPGETDSEIWHGAKGFTVLDNKYFIPLFRKK